MTEDSTGVGAELARAREARGLSIAELAQQLKFAPRQLEALEHERFEALPPVTITRGMVRNYARVVRLDPEPLLERLAGRFNVPDSGRLATRYSEPVPFSDSGRRSTVLYLALSVLVLGAGAAVAYQWYEEHDAVNQPAVMAAASQTLDAPTSPAPAQPPVPAAEPPPPAAVEPEPAPAQAVEEAAPLAVAAVEKPMTKSDEPKPASGSRKLVLRNDEEAWIEVRDGANRLLVSSLNPAGSERVLYGKPPFALVLGNAHHVRVFYDDKPVDLQSHIKVEVARFTLK